MSNKVTSVDQLRQTALACQGLAAEVAGAAADAIAEVAEALPVRRSVTLTAAGWAGSGPYTQTVSVAGVRADEAGQLVQVAPASASRGGMERCGSAVYRAGEWDAGVRGAGDAGGGYFGLCGFAGGRGMIINPVLYQQGVKLPELENPGAAADLLSGKQLVDQYGNPLTGTMPTATHPKPTLSRSGGTITAQHVQSAGYTDGGTTTETLSITTQAGKTVTPGTSRQTAVASGRLTTGAVYVAGDTNLKAENIKSGVSIFGVAGSAVSAASPITCRIYNNVGSNLDVMYFESDFISNPIETVLPSSGNIQIQTLPNAPIIIYPSAIGTSLDREVLDKGPNSLNCATAFLFREYDTGAYKGAYYRSTVFVFSAAGSLYVTIR